MTNTPTGSNADEWALFLSEWGTAYCAVQIAEAIEARQAEARAKGIRDAAAIVGTEVGHKGDAENCQCGMCVARRKDHAAILAILDQPAETEGVTVQKDGFLSLVRDGMAEGDKAMLKFPQPNYVISKFAEEAGEVVKAAIHCAEERETPENVLGEMRQVIAMMYRLWVEGDQVHALRALSSDRHE